ncbi:hypothetical protein EHQ76_05415 [Leptospira barantonii]|uniref:DUF2846 domain-containing protein n=1 Tax=Leptospira barantonii TaxID=2023184 RepID=A0A5F2BN94_9LEPT|nr:hypothetical protein [Leptospira barantonii]TGM07033.1 hypothetical protein EHQ76_05415 [Leptospira barantonii]
MTRKISFCILFFVLIGCGASKSKFIRLKKESVEQTSLYLLRPSRVPLAFWKQTIFISKYSGTFQDSAPAFYAKVVLDDGEYIQLNLEEGYYRLNSRDAEKILFLGKNKTYFVDYFLFNEGFFSFPELYFKELNKETAIEFLIDSSHMDRHENSTD